MNLLLTITTDQGEWQATADMRDLARWEQYASAQGLPLRVSQEDENSSGVLWLMHLAWTASKRAGRTAVKFPEWLDLCSNVEAQEQPDVDPTQQAAGAT